MKAKVKQRFKGVPDGECYTRTFAPGDEVTGDLAAVAVAEGFAEPIGEQAPKPEQPTAPAVGNAETPGAVSQQGQASRKNKSRKSERPE